MGRDRHGTAALSLDRAAAERWIRARVDPSGEIETAHERPWSTILRIPVAGGLVWFKECAPVQAFEPRLSAALFERWPDLGAGVLAHDEERAWILFEDAGLPIAVSGNPPEAWLELLPRYAELQRGEVEHADDHVAHGVPDLRLPALPARYEAMLRERLPIDPDEVERLRSCTRRFAGLCDELAARGIPATIQHDDLHMANVYAGGGRLRVLDWGDASVAHPFFSLVVPFLFLEERNGRAPEDAWFDRLRAAYLEPWGHGLDDALRLAERIGRVAHVFAWLRQRDHLDEPNRSDFDTWFPLVLRRALAAMEDPDGFGQPRAAR